MAVDATQPVAGSPASWSRGAFTEMGAWTGASAFTGDEHRRDEHPASHDTAMASRDAARVRQQHVKGGTLRSPSLAFMVGAVLRAKGAQEHPATMRWWPGPSHEAGLPSL